MGYKKALAALSIYLISGTADAARWSITPSLNVSESYSDNLLASQHAPQSSWITEVTPTLSIFGRGKNLDANLIYRLANVNYQAQSASNDNYDYYKANLGVRPFDNQWLINLSATKGRFVSNLSDGIGSGESFVAPNQTGISHYIVSSSFGSRASDSLVYHINLQANKVHGQNNFHNKEALAGSLSINNGSQPKRSYWQLSVDSHTITGDPASNVNRQDFRHYQGEIGFNFSEDYWLFLQYFDQQNALDTGRQGKLDSSNYGAGLRWHPSDKIDIKLAYNKSLDIRYDDFTSLELTLMPSHRTRLYLTTGQRFYGDYYELLFNYRLKRFSSTISYHERIMSYNLGLFERPLQGDLICPVSAQFNINDCHLSTSVEPIPGSIQQLIRVDEFSPDDNQHTYLDKQFNVNFSYSKRKINVFFSFSRSQRTDLDSQNERQEHYATVLTGYRIKPRANINLSLSYRDSKLNPDQLTQSSAKDLIVSLGLDHKLTRSAVGRFRLSHRNRDATGSLRSYDENRVVISITKEF